MILKIIIDILLTLAIASIIFVTFKEKNKTYLKITAIILFLIHITNIIFNYFLTNQTIENTTEIIRFIITMYLAVKVLIKKDK